MAFVKGVSGNPSGRKPLDPKIKAMFDALVPLAVKAIKDGLTDADPKIRMKAAELSLDRAIGKPHQTIDADHSGSISITSNVFEIKPKS